MQLERTNCKRNALICMQIRLEGSPCVCASVRGPECLTAKTWHKAKGGNCLHIHMQSHTHSPTHWGGKSCHNKSRIDSWQAKRLQRQETETETPRKYATNMKRTHTHLHTHTHTRKTVCKLLCVTLTYRVARWPVLLTIQIVFSLWFLLFFLLTYMPSGCAPCYVLNARLKAGNACFLRLLYAYLMSAVRWVYHNNNDVHTHTKRQAHTHVRLTLTVTVKL